MLPKTCCLIASRKCLIIIFRDTLQELMSQTLINHVYLLTFMTDLLTFKELTSYAHKQQQTLT